MSGLRPGPQTDVVLGRLRAWSVSSWRHRDREAAARDCLQLLAALAAEAEGGSVRPVPDAGLHALGDQLAVLVADARAAGVSELSIDRLTARLAIRLGLR